MTWLLRSLALLALLATVAPSLLYLAGSLELLSVHRLMLAATLAWFVAQGLLASRRREG